MFLKGPPSTDFYYLKIPSINDMNDINDAAQLN